MRILIADDHAAVRHGLREILADALPEAEFSEADNGDEVLGQLAGAEYAALLLDINMPGRSGLEVLREVKRNFPRLPVIMVSVQPEDQYAAPCLQAGADAYINKDSASEELAIAIKQVLDGRRYIGSRLAEKRISKLDGPLDPIGQPS
jgi:two-component system, NarL family, invasion response regulator UvrY